MPLMQRTLHAFQIHAHVNGSALSDYKLLFERIKSMPARQRRMIIEERVITLSAIKIAKDFVIVTAQDGDKNVKPLLYDTATNHERVGTTAANEVVSVRTHAVIDLRTRYVAIEYNRKGAKAAQILAILTQLALTFEEYRRITIEMPPIVGEGFFEELEKYTRVRLATVEMVRPNFDWDDCVDPVMGVAKDSGAQKVNITFTAEAQESLSKRAGILSSIKRIVRSGRAIFSNILVRGNKQGIRGEVPLKLNNHADQRKVDVDPNPLDGHPVPASVIQGLMKYLKDLSEAEE